LLGYNALIGDRSAVLAIKNQDQQERLIPFA
jgi:hypothetical protein